MQREDKRLLGHGLLDVLLILSFLRQSDISLTIQSERYNRVPSYEGISDDGPVMGVVAPPAQPFQHNSIYAGHGQSWKSGRDPSDEYDRIMHDIRSRPPAAFHGGYFTRQIGTPLVQPSHNQNSNRSVVTMVLSRSVESSPFRHGGVQVVRNTPLDGAVGGAVQPFLAEENFDLFTNFMPGNMGDDEINDLLSENGVASLNQTFPDVNWQQFIADYDSFMTGATGVTKAADGTWGSPDLLSEAIQSSELFLPVPSGSQNQSEFSSANSETGTLGNNDALAASRLEMIEYDEWASRNHEEDLLFPSLSPPSYEEVMAAENLNTTSQDDNPPTWSNGNTNHLHDHNYFNATATENTVASPQSASYAIRSRHEVSTRVISVAPRGRRASTSTESSLTSTSTESSEIVDLTASDVSAPSPDSHITISSEENSEGSSQLHQNNFDSGSFRTYFDNLSRSVGARREVILCN